MPPTAGRSARSSCGGGASGPSGAPWTRPCPRRCQRHQRHQRRKRRTACPSRGRAYALTSPSPPPPFAGGARGTCTPCGSACGGACAAGTTGPTQVRAGRRSGSHPPRWPPCLRPEPGVRGGGGGLGRKRRLEGRSVGVVVRVVWLLCGIWCVLCAPKQRGSVDGDGNDVAGRGLRGCCLYGDGSISGFPLCRWRTSAYLRTWRNCGVVLLVIVCGVECTGQ